MERKRQTTATDLPADVREALDRGQTMEAIRRLRAERNLDLKEAHDLVRAHTRQSARFKQPQLDSMIQEDRSSPMLLIVLVLLAIGAGVYWFFF